MTKVAVEFLFGTNAGIVWKALNQNGSSNIRSLVKTTSLSREEVFGALGWLGREDKLVIEQKGRAMVFSLREGETRLSVPEETTAEPASKAKSKRRKSKPPKKVRESRKIKTPVKQADKKMEESLLH